MPVTKSGNEKYIDPLGTEREVTMKSVAIDRHDKATIYIPEKLEVHEAIYWLTAKMKEENQKVSVKERIEGYPLDVAYALGEACLEMFGFRELKAIPHFFGETPPEFMSVPINYKGETTEVFIGQFAVPGTEGKIASGRELNDALIVGGTLRKKDVPLFKSLITLTRKLLAERSLYRGKAFRVKLTQERDKSGDMQRTMAHPQFMDTVKLPAELMLDDVSTRLLRAALYTPITQSAKTRRYGVNLRRGIGLFGDFGTGKTLTAAKTAQICEQHGWTFIYVMNVFELREMYRFAARYAPAVLFAEDIDRLVDKGEEGINMLNNVLDGVDTKNTEVITVLTTNYVEKLPQSLIRHGRFHTLIEYKRPDATTAARLVEQFAGEDLDLDNYDSVEVGAALAGNIPATIAEVVARAKLFSIDRADPEFSGELKLATEDLILSAHSMKQHMDLLNRQPKKNPTMIEAFAETLGKNIASAAWAAQLGIQQLNDEQMAMAEATLSAPATELDAKEVEESRAEDARNSKRTSKARG